VAREIGAINYLECSAATAEGVEEMFLCAINAIIYPQLNEGRSTVSATTSANLDEEWKDPGDLIEAATTAVGTVRIKKKKGRCIVC